MIEWPVDRPEWMDDAACRNQPPMLWMSSSDDGVMDRSTARQGARVCFAKCRVREKCLSHSMTSAAGEKPEPQGVWGGLTYPQRIRWHAAQSVEERAAIEDDARRLAQIVPRVW